MIFHPFHTLESSRTKLLKVPFLDILLISLFPAVGLVFHEGSSDFFAALVISVIFVYGVSGMLYNVGRLFGGVASRRKMAEGTVLAFVPFYVGLFVAGAVESNTWIAPTVFCLTVFASLVYLLRMLKTYHGLAGVKMIFASLFVIIALTVVSFIIAIFLLVTGART